MIQILMSPSSLGLRSIVFVIVACAICLPVATTDIKSFADYNPGGFYAINHGHPFHLYRGAQDGSSLEPEKLLRYVEIWGDYGFQFSISILSLIGDQLGVQVRDGYSARHARYVLPAVYVFAASAFLLAATPIFFLLLGNACLLLTVFAVNEGLTGWDGRSVDAIAVVLGGLALARAASMEWKRADVPFFLILGLACGWLVLFRQTAFSILMLGTGLYVLAMTALVFTASRLRRQWRPLVWNLASGPGVLIASCLAAKMLAFVIFAAYYSDWSNRVLPSHGSGQPLYLSLGWAANPYGIAWEDEVSYVNVQLFADRRNDWTTEIQNSMEAEYWKIVGSDQWIFVANVMTRFQKFNDFILSPSPDVNYRTNTVDTVSPSILHTTFYLLWWALCIAVVALLIVRRFTSVRQLGLTAAILALPIGALAPPLLIQPGYYAGAVGLVFVSVLVLAPAYLASFPARRSDAADQAAPASIELDRSELRVLGLALVLFLVIATAYVGVRQLGQHLDSSALAEEAHPLSALKSTEETFSYAFNRLDVSDQEEVLRRIQTAGREDPDVLCNHDWAGAGDSEDLFVPVCVVTTHAEQRRFQRAHVFVYLSSRWRPPTPAADQGPVGAWITVAGKDCLFPTMWYFHDRCLYTRIADSNWRDRFYAFVLPATGTFGRDPCGYRVGSYELVTTAAGQENRLFASVAVASDALSNEADCEVSQ